jgi:hypothetical protein
MQGCLVLACSMPATAAEPHSDEQENPMSMVVPCWTLATANTIDELALPGRTAEVTVAESLCHLTFAGEAIVDLNTCNMTMGRHIETPDRPQGEGEQLQ